MHFFAKWGVLFASGNVDVITEQKRLKLPLDNFGNAKTKLLCRAVYKSRPIRLSFLLQVQLIAAQMALCSDKR